MQDRDTITTGARSNTMKKVGIWAAILLVVFLLGFIPMWLQKREASNLQIATQRQLDRTEIKGLLTAAIVEARRGEYESARQLTSDFYTRLRAQIDDTSGITYSSDERGKLNSVFADRDATITMLAQRDPASSEKLTQMYIAYQTAVGQPPTTTTTASPAQTPAQP